MGHKFSLILSREITDDESTVLQESGCYGASFAPDKLPTDAEVTVTKIDIDDTVSPSLAEAIESALEAAKKVPDLSVPGLIVPGLPVEKKADKPGTVDGEVIEDEPSASSEASVSDEDEPSASSEDEADVSSEDEPSASDEPSEASAMSPANGEAAAEAAESANDAESASDAEESSPAVTVAD